MTQIYRELIGEFDGVTVRAVQDVEPYLDFNKAAQNDGYNGFTPSRDMRHIASIPLLVAEKWMNELGVDVFNPNHAKKVKELLASSDWCWLRTVPKI